MSDEWKVGDLALCIKADGILYVCGIRSNCVYKVTKVVVSPAGFNDSGEIGLGLEGFNDLPCPTGCVNARYFKKIKPDELEPCEEEFVTLLNRIKAPTRENVISSY